VSKPSTSLSRSPSIESCREDSLSGNCGGSLSSGGVSGLWGPKDCVLAAAEAAVARRGSSTKAKFNLALLTMGDSGRDRGDMGDFIEEDNVEARLRTLGAER